MVNTLEDQTEDIMGFPTGGDPSIIDPTTGKPYDSSGRVRQQQEITRQSEASEEFTEETNKAKLQKDMEAKVAASLGDYRGSYSNLDSSGNIEGALDSEGFFLNPREPLKRDSEGRLLESLRPKLRPTEDFGPSFNFKSPIDKTIELNYLLRDPNAVYKGLEIVSGLKEDTEFGEKAIGGFYDSVAEDQGLSATENAWCAAFVHYILTELGADTLKGLGGQRARKYIDYGSPVDNIKDSQEGDIVIFDFNDDGKGDHVAFYAGTRITDQDNPNKISVVGGNQGNEVSLMSRSTKDVLGIRRITKDDISVSLSKDLAKNNPIFKLFVPPEKPAPQLGPTIQMASNFSQGGLTDMNNQTQMAFALGGEAETVDPISGNDVPPGSLPVEVRDDIDAKLSEGEYVVPADVVRFFGVKYFEDLRMEAKNGLQQMDADGRIGGEPVADEPQMQMAEMGDQDIDALIDAEMNNMNQGGMIGQQNPSNSMYSDPNKVDDVIAKIGEAAAQNPEISRMLGERGIAVPTTGAMQTPEEMKDANTPEISEEPKIAANQGGLMGYAPGGSVSGYDPSAVPTIDIDFDQGFDSEAYLNTLMSEEGATGQLTSQLVIMPDGTEEELYWPTNIPLPEGYKSKVSMAIDTVDTVGGLGSQRREADPVQNTDPDYDGSKSKVRVAPNVLDYDKLTLREMQVIGMDIDRKKGFMTVMPLGSIANAAASANYKAGLVKKQREIDTFDEPRKTEAQSQLNNLKKGVHVDTGKPLVDISVSATGLFGPKKGSPASPVIKELREIQRRTKLAPNEQGSVALDRTKGVELGDIATTLKFVVQDAISTQIDATASLLGVDTGDIFKLPLGLDVKAEGGDDGGDDGGEDGGEDVVGNAAEEIISSIDPNPTITSKGIVKTAPSVVKPSELSASKATIKDTDTPYIAPLTRQSEDGNQAEIAANKAANEAANEAGAKAVKEQQAAGRTESYEQKAKRKGGYNKGGLINKPKTSYANGGYVTSKKTNQRKNGLASRS